MITVRFPSGLVVTYNNAGHLRYTTSAWELSTKDPDKGGAWIASIQHSAGALVEVVPPCSVTSPPHETTRAVEGLRGYIKRSTAARRRRKP